MTIIVINIAPLLAFLMNHFIAGMEWRIKLMAKCATYGVLTAIQGHVGCRGPDLTPSRVDTCIDLHILL